MLKWAKLSTKIPLKKQKEKVLKPLGIKAFQDFFKWLRRKDLNQRPSGYESDVKIAETLGTTGFLIYP